MRRMKIRAVPNIGGGGNVQRVNQLRKPPDVNSEAQSSTETSKAKTGTHGTTNTLLEQSVAGISSKTELVGNGETGKKAAITIELDSSDVKQVGLETVSSKSDSPTFHSRQNTYGTEDCDRDKICPDVEVLPTFSSKKRKEPLPNIDDEIQEVAATESIQCLGTYKRLYSPLNPSSTEPSATSNKVEIVLETRNELSASFDGKPVSLSPDNAKNSKSRSDSDGKTVNLSLDNTENSQSNIRKSNERSPKRDTNPSSPVSVINCVTADGNKGNSGNINSVSTEVVIDDEKRNGTETGKNVITLESDKVCGDTACVSSVGMSREKTPPVPLGTLTRRPKIRAKPSFVSNIGKKTLSHSRKEVSVPVTPVIKAQTEEVILDDDDNSNGNSLSKTNEATSIKDGNGVEIQSSHSLGAKSQEILLDDGNDIQGVGSEDVLTTRSAGNISSVSTEVVIDDEKLNGTELGKNVITLESDKVCGDTVSVSSVGMSREKTPPVPLGTLTEGTNGIPNYHSDVLFEKIVLDKGEMSVPPVQIICHEKSLPKAVGPSVRRRKINAMPSIVKFGRKQMLGVESSRTSDMNHEKSDQDKQITQLAVDGTSNSGSSSSNGTSEVGKKMAKELDEKETIAKQNRDFITEESFNSSSSVHTENKQDLPTSREDRESFSSLKLSQSDPSENSGSGKVKTTESILPVGSAESTPSISLSSNIRRSKIRAKPSLFSKRKMLQVEVQEDLVEVDKESKVAEQTQARLLAEKILEEKAGETRNEISTDCSLATSDNVSNQAQTRILAEKLSEEKGGENKIEINADPCDAIPDTSMCKSNEALASTQSISKSSVVAKKRQFSEGIGNFDTKTKKAAQHNRKKVDTGVHELAISDDSGGDKENSSKCVSVGKAARRERHIKESGKVPTYNKSKSKLLRHDSQEKKQTVKSEKKLNSSDNFDSDSEESLQKKIFRERKEKFRKKLNQSQGNIERGQMTMFDLIFWNPINNPMPGRTEMNKKKDNLVSSGGVDDAASDILEEQMVDDLGLECKSVAGESKPNSPGSHRDEVEVCDEDCLSPKSNQLDAENCEGEEDKKKEDDEEEESVRDVFAPRVKIGPNGQIILDEQSIKIQTTAAKNRDEILSKAEVVEESNDTAHYGKWNKRRRRSCEWTMKETARFYKALSTVGTDFSLMETLFTWRSRAELKTKFKKEERTNRDLVDRALKDSTQFDFTPFDEESDYDPEEDRKASRIAERAEAKRKRLEMKQSQKEEERLRKKMHARENIKKNKERQAVLRKIRNKMKSEKKAKRTTNTDQLNDAVDAADDGISASDSDVEYEPSQKLGLKSSGQDPVPDLPRKRRVVKPKWKNSDQDPVADLTRKRRVLKKKRPKTWKSSSPLEISEVTVTVETVKSQKSEMTVPVTYDTGCEMTVCEDVSMLESTGLDKEKSMDKLGTDIATFGALADVTESPAHNCISSELKDTVGSSEVRVISSSISLTEDPLESKSAFGNDKMWDVPLSAVKVNEDGTNSVSIPTETGEKMVPVPHIPPGTSSVVVVATKGVETQGDYIYHVYTISPSQE